jgi:hypothetical protein
MYRKMDAGLGAEESETYLPKLPFTVTSNNDEAERKIYTQHKAKTYLLIHLSLFKISKCLFCPRPWLL